MSNTNADIVGRAKRLHGLLDQIADLLDEVKLLKSEAKSDGYNPKVLSQIVKEMRRGAQYQADQLTLELEVKTYREAAGLPTDLAVAQQRAAHEAGTAPAHGALDRVVDKYGGEMSIQAGDGEPVYFGSRAKARGRKAEKADA